MRNSVQSAKDVSQIYETCITALNGLLHAYLDSPNAMSRKNIREFEAKAIEIAQVSLSDTINRLKAVSSSIIYEARLQAHTDAASLDSLNKIPTIERVDADIKEIEQLIRQDYMTAVIRGVSLAKKLMAQYNMLIASGVNHNTARIRIRERNRGVILQVYSVDRKGRNYRTCWSVYIKLAAFLNQLAYMEYLSESAKLGYRKFVILAPGKLRDGMTFTLDTVPDGELHPQSQADIRLVKGE